MKKIAILVAATCMIAGTTAFAKGPSKKDAAAAVQNAVKAVESAKSVRGEWRDSYKILGKAKKAYKKGDYATSVKLAGQVERQGKMGKAQAMAEANATYGKDVR
ncbi:MAG: hypothetical protein HKM22_04460 [Gammaproteobacteria bacterium]|nr:hypothetical protein [Gammaproteobacteria bacterium]